MKVEEGAAYWGEMIVLLAMAVRSFSEMEKCLTTDPELSAAQFQAFMDYLRRALNAAAKPPKGWYAVRSAVQIAICPVVDFAEASLKFQAGNSKANPVGSIRKLTRAQSALDSFPLKLEHARSIAARLQRAAGGSRAEIISLDDAVSLSLIPTE